LDMRFYIRGVMTMITVYFAISKNVVVKSMMFPH